jgi:hypothetical protein
MEPLKSIKFDIDRIILQLVIPGLFSALPFFLLFINSHADVKEYFIKSEGICSAAIFIIALTFGLILEDLGSWVEDMIFDFYHRKYEKEDKRDVNKEWDQYLTLEISDQTDVVAQRYLRTILIRMKFEYSFSISLVVMIIGLVFLNSKIHFLSDNFILICVVIPILLSGYLMWEAKNSTELLIKIRKLILDKFQATTKTDAS